MRGFQVRFKRILQREHSRVDKGWSKAFIIRCFFLVNPRKSRYRFPLTHPNSSSVWFCCGNLFFRIKMFFFTAQLELRFNIQNQMYNAQQTYQ